MLLSIIFSKAICTEHGVVGGFNEFLWESELFPADFCTGEDTAEEEDEDEEVLLRAVIFSGELFVLSTVSLAASIPKDCSDPLEKLWK